MVELVYKFDKKSTISVLIAKVPFKLFGGHIHTHIYIGGSRGGGGDISGTLD